MRRSHRLVTVDAEGDDSDAVRRIIPQAKNFHAVDVAQAVDELRAQQLLVTRCRLCVVRCESVARGGDRRDPQHVRGSGLMTGRCARPLGVVEGDLTHRAATGEVRLCLIEPVTTPDKHSGTERCIQLVSREREVVDAQLSEIDATMRNQLGTVDEDPRTARVGEIREFGDRKHLAGHIGGSRDGKQCRRRTLELDGDPPDGLRDRIRSFDHTSVLPRQQVRVMFDVEDHDLAGDRTGQQVDRIRGVAGEDHDLVLVAPTNRETDSRESS